MKPLNKKEKNVVARCLVMLKVHLEFLKLAGCQPKDINPREFTLEALDQIKKSGIKNPDRIRLIMGEIANGF